MVLQASHHRLWQSTTIAQIWAQRVLQRRRGLSYASSSVSSVTAATVSLTSAEKKLFSKLENARRQCCPQATVRVAGGWVRNKLLGISSTDIDLVVDRLSGAEFASLFADYLRKSHSKRESGFGIVRKNPSQSKHLETACMTVDGFALDFVQLRTEDYAAGTRVPTKVAQGTVEQDARRRDFTVNAMFYNLSEGVVEDYTGQGLSDLKKRIIRTPLPAAETFKDDPLRALRAVRFASRYNLSLDNEILEAASDPSLHEELRHKVSRERYGIEVEKMFHAQSKTSAALSWFRDMGLLPIIFLDLQHINNAARWEEVIQEVQCLDQAIRWNNEELPNAKFAAVLRPVADQSADTASLKVHMSSSMGLKELFLLGEEYMASTRKSLLRTTKTGNSTYTVGLKLTKKIAASAASVAVASSLCPARLLESSRAKAADSCTIESWVEDVCQELGSPSELSAALWGVWSRQFRGYAPVALCSIWASTASKLGVLPTEAQCKEQLEALIFSHQESLSTAVAWQAPILNGKEIFARVQQAPFVGNFHKSDIGRALDFTLLLQLREAVRRGDGTFTAEEVTKWLLDIVIPHIRSYKKDKAWDRSARESNQGRGGCDE